MHRRYRHLLQAAAVAVDTMRHHYRDRRDLKIDRIRYQNYFPTHYYCHP
jgi:hypothetical protein